MTERQLVSRTAVFVLPFNAFPQEMADAHIQATFLSNCFITHWNDKLFIWNLRMIPVFMQRWSSSDFHLYGGVNGTPGFYFVRVIEIS